eukprot:TRINITY_DN34614_c0_g1_i1.p1 TRINITY_DN34614_c0_g1~~TRINITY_DN34614_c0_g1_i1.p1  ORF type:complete len:940 (-),score=193.07 TRINITY_DN34614_c0_g1_i1:88-2907(-)
MACLWWQNAGASTLKDALGKPAEGSASRWGAPAEDDLDSLLGGRAAPALPAATARQPQQFPVPTATSGSFLNAFVDPNPGPRRPGRGASFCEMLNELAVVVMEEEADKRQEELLRKAAAAVSKPSRPPAPALASSALAEARALFASGTLPQTQMHVPKAAPEPEEDEEEILPPPIPEPASSAPEIRRRVRQVEADRIGPPLCLSVALASTRDVVIDDLELDPVDLIDDLATEIEESLGKPVGTLQGPNGIVLDREATVGASGLRDGDLVLVALAPPVQVYATRSAFVAVNRSGAVVSAWGDAASGGDISAVKDQLSSGVEHVYATEKAFAAVKRDGSVVVWGDPSYGGDPSSVQGRLLGGVLSVCATKSAFAALKDDGNVVTWQVPFVPYGGRELQWRLQRVSRLHATSSAFAALTEEGSVITWGDEDCGGDSSGIGHELARDVQRIYAAEAAFAAVKTDGSVVTWGNGARGGDSSAVEQDLAGGVERIFGNASAFCALKADGSAVAWGQPAGGGDCTPVAAELRQGVRSIVSTKHAFAALKEDGSVVAWGDPDFGGSGRSQREVIIEVPGRKVADPVWVDMMEGLSGGVEQVVATEAAFAALKEDGSVVAWGSLISGGDTTRVQKQLSGAVVAVFPNQYAFAALKSNGSVVTWGGRQQGGDSGTVQRQLASGVVHVFASRRAFAAVKSNGSVVAWGHDAVGGTGLPASISSPPGGGTRRFGGFGKSRKQKEDASEGVALSSPATARDSPTAPDDVEPDAEAIDEDRSSHIGRSRGSLNAVPSEDESTDVHGRAALTAVAEEHAEDEQEEESMDLPPEPSQAWAAPRFEDIAERSLQEGDKEAKQSRPTSASTSFSAATTTTTKTRTRKKPTPSASDKKLSPEEIARQSDAFWASVEATIGPQTSSSATTKKLSTSKSGPSLTSRGGFKDLSGTRSKFA